MAEVFKAKSFGVEGFERVVAVKRILPTLAEDDEFITMFIDEARIAAHLTHQNIVQIYELGKFDDIFFISMEYVAGRDLRQILDFQKKTKRPMEISKACFVVSRVCEALEYAHRKKDPAGRDLKIIHRDVTPQNVIISYEGEVKLCDFGIAKAASRVSRTQVGVLKGKFAYMSPEQVRGQPTDRRSDIFALGVIFYEMITGERLFLGESDYSTLESVRNAVIPSARALNPAITPELEAILLKMLARDPRERYQWASEVHEELLDHLIADGRIYHGRHLRQWLQGVYAREIEIENAKLEEFMRLKMPPAEATEDLPPPPSPASVLVRRADSAVKDPADELDAADPTDNFELPVRPRGHSKPTVPIEDAAIPTIASHSPVSNLFGAPDLADGTSEAFDASVDAEMVLPAGSEPKKGAEPEVEIQTDGERTQFDMQVVDDSNETLFDEGNETELGGSPLEHEINAAQAELISRLDAAGALDNGDTVDASIESQEIVAPEVSDPSEESPTWHDEESDDGEFGFEPTDGGDPTSISPLVMDDETAEGGLAETFARAASNEGLDFANDGTMRDAAGALAGPRVTPAVEVRRRPSSVRRSAEANAWDRARTGDGAPRRRPQVRPAVQSPARANGSNGEVRPGFADVESARPFAGPGEVPVGFMPPADDMAHATPPPVRFSGPRAIFERLLHLEGPKLSIVLAVGVGFLALSLLVAAVSMFRSTAASLEIVTEPVQTQVEVRIDGALVATQTPVEIESLAVGTHRVEIRAAGFRVYTQTIEIAEPKPHSMAVPLERLKPGPAAPDEESAPMPDGDALEDPDEPTPERAAPERAAPERAAPERAAPERAAAERTAPQPAPSPPPPAVAPPPAAASPPPARTPVLPVPPPIRPKEPVDPPPPAEPPPRLRRSEGSLVVSTRPAGVLVFIDGTDTGMRTPIRRPYALPAGRHTITFEMSDGKRYSFDVDIKPGELTKLVKPLR